MGQLTQTLLRLRWPLWLLWLCLSVCAAFLYWIELKATALALMSSGYLLTLLLFAVRRLTASHQIIEEQILAHVDDLILLVDHKGIIQYANQAVTSMLGYTPEQLIGKAVEVMAPEGMLRHHPALRQLFHSSRGRVSMRNTVSVVCQDGSVIQADIRLRAVELNGQHLVLCAIRSVDGYIAENKRLTQERHTYFESFDRAAVGIAHVSLGGRFMRVNQYLVDFLGYSREQIEALTFQEITHPDDLDTDLKYISALLAGNLKFYSMDKRYLNAQHNYVWMHLTVSLVRDDQQNSKYFISVIDDISAQKATESMLAVTEKKFLSAVEGLSNRAMMWMATPSLKQMVYVNCGYETIWEDIRQNLYKNPMAFLEMVHEEDKARVYEELFRMQHASWKIQYRIVTANGHLKHIQDEGQGIYDNDGRLEFLIGTAFDITAQIEKEQETARLLTELALANQRLENTASRDGLTGLMNRHYIEEELRKDLLLYKRYGTPSTIVFIDLNKFKQVNDKFGHQAGDKVLVAFAAALLKFTRNTDVAARYGGDEFLILLRNTNADQAQEFISRNCMEPVVTALGQNIYNIEYSVGLSTLSEDVGSIEEWLEYSDEKMYEHKKSGR